MAIAGLSHSFSAFLGLSCIRHRAQSSVLVSAVQIHHIAFANANTSHVQQYLNILCSKTRARALHKAPYKARLSTRNLRANQSILKKAQRRCPPSLAALPISEIIYWRHLYNHAPHVCLESSLSLPAGSLLCGLNSRWVAITGHTIGGGQFDKLGQGSLAQTFFKAGMSSETDLVPHITHSIRTSNFRPMVKEVLYLDLFIIISCPVNLDQNNLLYEQLRRWLRKLRRPRKGHSPP